MSGGFGWERKKKRHWKTSRGEGRGRKRGGGGGGREGLGAGQKTAQNNITLSQSRHMHNRLKGMHYLRATSCFIQSPGHFTSTWPITALLFIIMSLESLPQCPASCLVRSRIHCNLRIVEKVVETFGKSIETKKPKIIGQ